MVKRLLLILLLASSAFAQTHSSTQFNPKRGAGSPNVGAVTCTPTTTNLTQVLYWDTTNFVWYYCSAVNTWTQFGSGGGGGLADPGSNGIIKRTALNVTAPAVSGTDFQAPISTFTAAAHKFVKSFTAPNTYADAQPDFSDLTGSSACSQLPALTGNVTTPGGSCATTIANGVVTEAMQVLADNTTNNSSTANHGYIKKLSNNATDFMNGQGNWAVPAGGGGGGYDPTDFTKWRIIENWTGFSNAADEIGTLRWSKFDLGTGSSSAINEINDANHPLTLRIHAVAGAGTGGGMFFLRGIHDDDNFFGATSPGLANAITALFDLKLKFKLLQTSTTIIRLGIGNGNVDGTKGAFLRYDTSVADTTFHFVTSPTGSDTNSTIAVDTNWHTLRIRAIDATHIGFTLDGNAEISIAQPGAGAYAVYPFFVCEGIAVNADVLIGQWTMGATVTNP